MAQNSLDTELKFEVNKVYPSYSINRAQLHDAKTIKDINRYFKPSWIKKYESVTINTIHQSQSKKSNSKSYELTSEQKQMILMADVGSPITVDISYIPNNSLAVNEIQNMTFTLEIEADIDAQYRQGAVAMEEHLQKYLDKIPPGTYEGYALSAVKFTVDNDGEIVDAHILDYPRAESVDQILIDAVCNMPSWIPARYDNGKTIKQEYVFTVGNMENCIVNLLNIKKLPVE